MAKHKKNGFSKSSKGLAVHKRAKQDSRKRDTSVLAHDTADNREKVRLELNLANMKRRVNDLRKRLTAWSPHIEDTKNSVKNEPEKRPKSRRLAPETWKLTGAARPAWEVYDFDTRYSCPYENAHKATQAMVRQQKNLIAIYKGRFADAMSDEHSNEGVDCKEFLGALMQLGHLSVLYKQHKVAREAWLECMELEGNVTVLTTARENLMQLYMTIERYESAYRLGAERLKDETSTIIRFCTAWASLRLQKPDRLEAVALAVKANPFCAYFLAFQSTFEKVFEHLDELQLDDDGPQSSFEEALLYCSEDAKRWKEAGYEVEMKQCISVGLQNRCSVLNAADVAWENRLEVILATRSNRESHGLKMYAQMFSTAMEMAEVDSRLPTHEIQR